MFTISKYDLIYFTKKISNLYIIIDLNMLRLLILLIVPIDVAEGITHAAGIRALSESCLILLDRLLVLSAVVMTFAEQLVNPVRVRINIYHLLQCELGEAFVISS